MAFDSSIFFHAAVLTLSLQLTGFAAAYALQTEVFYDILGGVNYLVLAVWGLWEQHTRASPRLSIMTAVFLASRGWLLLFLAYRAHARKGDSRFDGVKNRFGRFLIFWLAQAFWVLLVSWPLIVVQALDKDLPLSSSSLSPPQLSELTRWDVTCLVGFAAGVLIEIVSDVQKTLWVNNGRKGTFCEVGLWKYSRHPNYFGEIFQWWCAWLLSYGSLATTSSPSVQAGVFWFLGILSPLFSMNILLNMSATGIWNAEGKSLQRYYDSPDGEAYRQYRASTSVLVPMIGYKHIPLWIKRLFLFEWERFEYNPKKTT